MHKPAPQCKLKRDLERQYDFKPVYAGGPYNLGTSSEFSKAMTKAFKKAGVHVDGHETRCIDRYRDYAWVATVNKEKSFQDGWEAQARAERPATSEEELRRREADTKQFIQESAFVIAQRAKRAANPPLPPATVRDSAREPLVPTTLNAILKTVCIRGLLLQWIALRHRYCY